MPGLRSTTGNDLGLQLCGVSVDCCGLKLGFTRGRDLENNRPKFYLRSGKTLLDFKVSLFRSDSGGSGGFLKGSTRGDSLHGVWGFVWTFVG